MTSKQIVILGAALVALATIGVFSPALRFEFVNWDDNLYVYQNPRLHPITFQNILWLFTHPYFLSWTPVALLFHAFDLKIWGTNPFGHHLSNVILHSANAVLVFWVSLLVMGTSQQVEKGSDPGRKGVASSATPAMVIGSVVAVLLFALHPLRAESVAWISDRKDLLCLFFMLITTIMFFSRRTENQKSKARYFWMLLFYVLALATKSVAAVLPVVFVLLDVLLFKRKLLRCLVEQIPFIVLGITTAIVAGVAASGAEKNFLIENKSVWELIAYPFATILFYLRNTIVPADLSPVYLTESFLPANWALLLSGPLVIIAITIFCLMKWRSGNTHWIIGWAAFVLFIAPTMAGIVAGIQPVADRYTYCASVSLCLLAGAGFQHVFGRNRKTWITAAVVLLPFLSYRTIEQISIWKDSLTLWTHTVRRAPVHFAYNNLGMAQLDKKMFDDAIGSFKSAIAVRPSIIWMRILIWETSIHRKPSLKWQSKHLHVP